MRAIAALVLGLAGCFAPSEYDCDLDSECSGGDVCARTHECLAPAEVRGVRVRWAIGTAPDVAAACAQIALTDLTIVYSTSDGVSPLTYTPVPCAGGSFFIDKLPLRFDRVELSGSDAAGVQYFGTTAIGTDPEYTIALQ
jgi:hypothetical protein